MRLKILFLILFVGAAILMVFFQRKIACYSNFHRLQAEAVFRTGEREIVGINMVPGKILSQIKNELKIDLNQLESLRVPGKLLVEKSDDYRWGISYSQSGSFSIDNQVVVSSDRLNPTGRIYLTRGIHEFELNIRGAPDRKSFLLLWKNAHKKNWTPVKHDTFYADSSSEYSIEQLTDFREKVRIFGKLYSFLVYLFMILFVVFIFIYIDKSFAGFTGGQTSEDAWNTFMEPGLKSRSRFFEIDATKGFAAFLMIAFHVPGGNTVLPFGSFGAALFFFCSGMNTIIFLDRSKHLRGINGYHLFFIILLFFGGYTQIVITHRDAARLIPEFLQFNALSILLVFVLFKIFKNPRYLGYLFFIPFLIHLGFKYNVLSNIHISRSVEVFFVGKHVFPLFPWSGFMIFGIFMFNVREKPKIQALILTATGLAAILTGLILKIPVSRFDMSISYIFLALFILAFLFSGFSRLESKSASGWYRVLRINLALVGRNSLILVYLHYFVLLFLLPAIPDESPVMELIFQSLIVFVLCTFFIRVYEKIKTEYSLLIPVLVVTFTLFFLRQVNLFDSVRDLRLIDMVIGIFFAYFYVQLRGKFRKLLKKRHTGQAVF